MASIKSSRYIVDGEVDPGIQEMAELILSRSRNHDLQGETADSTPLSEEDGWLFAAKIGSMDRRILNVDLAGTRDAYGNGGVEPFSRWLIDQALIAIRAEWPNAQRALESMALSPEVVQSLLFFQGEDGNDLPQRLQEARDTLGTSDVVQLAKAIASSVPPLGRTWVAQMLVRDGMGADAARDVAVDVYATGGNLLTFENGYARRKEVARILRSVDPNVTEQQIDRVVRSPLSLDEVRTSFGESDSSAGSTLLLVLAAAAAGLYFFLRKK